jgi:hypothetical protein
MNSIKLNKIENSQLNNNEKLELRGGAATPDCTCGCCYANDGGSSVEDNAMANTKLGIPTKCKKVVAWGFTL